MEDRPPPKKKSRFFSAGKSTIESIFHPSRRRNTQDSTLRPADSIIDHPANNDNHTEKQPVRHGARTSSSTGEINTSEPSYTSTKSFTTSNDHRDKDKRREGIYGVQNLTTSLNIENHTPVDSKEKNQSTGKNESTVVNEINLQSMPRQESIFQNEISGSHSQFTFRAPTGSTITTQSIQANHIIERKCQSPMAPDNKTTTPDISKANPVRVPRSNAQETWQPKPTPDAHSLPTELPSTQSKLTTLSTASNVKILQTKMTQTSGPTVDLDRDSEGKLLPPNPVNRMLHLRPNVQGELPFFAAMMPRPQSVPPNTYTTANRVTNAMLATRCALKRKRSLPTLPPPAYIYRRTNDPNFSVFQGILLYPELCFALASQMSVNTLVSLYAISKDFHTIIDSRFTTVILSQAISKAPESSRSFGFRSYAHLCRTDPAARIPHPNPSQAVKNIPRRIPSFRWLKMVLHREKVVHEIMTIFAEDGIPLPARCSLALKRMWFMLDIPDNARRIGFIHCCQIFTDLDLYFTMCFIVKLDMRLNDPVANEKRDGLRKMLLSQRSLTTILLVLKREIWRDQYEIMQAWLRYRYEHFIPGEEHLPVLGIPPKELGKLKFEYWGIRKFLPDGKPCMILLRPDQLIMREAVRRGLRFHKHFLRCLLYGYVRPDTLENYAPRSYGRRIESLKNQEYGLDDLVGGVSALKVEDGGDPFLDLGTPVEGSPYTIVKTTVSQDEIEQKEKQEKFLDMLVGLAERETKGVVGNDP